MANAWLILMPVLVAVAILAHATRTRAARAVTVLAQERDRARVAAAEAARLLRLGAHDVRHECMSLLGCSDGLLSPGADPARYADDVAAAAGRILSIADDFEDFATPDAATRVLDEERLDLGALVREAVTHVAATLGPTHRSWQLDPSINGLAIQADARALTTVLVRVLSNAARACRPQDAIEIGAVAEPDGYALTIEDEGSNPATAGLGASSPRANGRPDGRANGALDGHCGERRGLGLGLVLARTLMEAHGGALTLEAASRVGTKVTLRFPGARVTQSRPAPRTRTLPLPFEG